MYGLFSDVMIGAPYEGHNDSGAVYVYYGTKNGIEHKYRQVIGIFLASPAYLMLS